VEASGFGLVDKSKGFQFGLQERAQQRIEHLDTQWSHSLYLPDRLEKLAYALGAGRQNAACLSVGFL
jgi:hypothetical protein